MLAVFSRFSGQFLREILIRSLRGSLLVAGAMLTLSSTGLWQYMTSSFGAHDLRRAAAWSTVNVQPDVVVVTIDDEGFERYFGGVSPLDPAKLVPLLAAIREGAAGAEALVVDLDLSPGPQASGDRMTEFFAGAKPQRWVLADPVLQRDDPVASRAQWRAALCALKVRFAHPLLPSEFGYALLTHQNRGSLADVATGAPDGCALGGPSTGVAASGAQAIERMPAPLSARFLRDGVTVPFEGDLKMVQETLAALNPRAVVLGGSWGKSDAFLTPFGERSGAHLHAAAIAGRYAHLRLAPSWAQLLFAWMAVAAMSLLFGSLHRRLVQLTSPWAASHPGHAFLMRRVWPIALSLLTMACLLGVAEISAILLARFGLWFPSARTAVVVGASMLFVWNWGLNDMTPQSSIGGAWRRVVVDPIRADWASLVDSLDRLRGQPVQNVPAPAFASSVFGPTGGHAMLPALAAGEMTRSRAAVEAALAAASLLAQTVLPLVSLTYTLTKPL